MITTNTRAVILARVSTSDQATHGYSLAEQLEACRNQAQKLNCAVVREIAHDHTGTTFDRPDVDEIIDLAKAGQINYVITLDPDRWGRKLVDQLVTERELSACGVEVIYVSATYEDSPEGRFQKQVRAAVSELEAELIKARFQRGKRGRAKSGYVVLQERNKPYGYDYIPKTDTHKGHLVINEDQAEVVRRVFKLCIAGHTSRQIVKALNDDNVPPPGEGQRWYHGSILRMLHNETYAGTWHYNKVDAQNQQLRRPREDWIPVRVPAIIDRATYDQAQQTIQQAIDGRPPKSREFILRGFLYCSYCGYRMYGANRARRLYYYRCNKSHRGECPQVSLRAIELETVVWDVITGFILDPERITQNYRDQIMNQDTERQRLEDELDQIRKDIIAERRKEERAYELYIEEGNKARYSKTKEKCEQRLSALRVRQQRAENALAQTDLFDNLDLDELVAPLKAAIATVTDEQKKIIYYQLSVRLLAKDRQVAVTILDYPIDTIVL